MNDPWAWMMDILARIEHQQAQIIEILNELVANLDTASQQKAPNMEAPRVMRANDISLVRQPVENVGWIVRKIDRSGHILDEAFQSQKGSWHRIDFEGQSLMIHEARDAITL